jgi:hypothetical protein
LLLFETRTAGGSAAAPRFAAMLVSAFKLQR